MTHWTEDVFADRPEVFVGELEARLEDAGEEIAALLELLATGYDLEPRTALDVPCGIGRHSLELAERHVETTGVDLSETYLERARERVSDTAAGNRLTFEQGDLRELAGVGEFDLVLNAWTSVGYWDESTNRRVFSNLADCVAPGGALVLELTNRDGVMAHFDGDAVSETAGELVAERREYDPERARMTTTRQVFESTDDGYAYTGEMTFDLRLYAPVELRERLADAGLADVSMYADFEGTALERESPRLVVVARH